MIAKYPFGSLILFLLCTVSMHAADAASFDWRWTNRSGKLVHVQIADQPDLYWGVGKGGRENCSSCCFVCDGHQSSMLSFDPGPAVASPPKAPAIRKEEWVAEAGDAAVLIGALTIETGPERGLITFGNGASLPLERVSNAEEIWKVTPPQSPIVRRAGGNWRHSSQPGKLRASANVRKIGLSEAETVGARSASQLCAPVCLQSTHRKFQMSVVRMVVRCRYGASAWC